jgi:hypothetical protein
LASTREVEWPQRLKMRIDPGEFRARPLRAHALLHDVPLEDVWAIRLRGGGAGRTIQDVRTVFIAAVEAAPPVVKGLFRLRARIGALLGWDHQRSAWTAESYVHRLSSSDRAQSAIAPGTPDGRLSLLYRFEDEQLSERRNATVHAFSSLSLQRTSDGDMAKRTPAIRLQTLPAARRLELPRRAGVA